MISSLLMFVPQEAYLPLLVFGGLLMIIGFRRIALGLVGTVLALAMFGPFIDALVESLPSWLFALLVLGFVLSIFRLVFGARVADNVISFLLYDLIRAPFRIIGWLLRGFGPRRRI